MVQVCVVAAGMLLLMGGGIGFLIVVALGIRREEATLSMTSHTSDRLANGVRAVNGLSYRSSGILQEVQSYRQGALARDGDKTRV